MIAGLVGCGDLRPRGERAQREAIGDALCSDENIWFNAVVFDSEHLAGAGEAGLNFVGNKENAVAIENFFYFFEVVRWRNDDSAFTHNRLCDERSNIVGSG